MFSCDRPFHAVDQMKTVRIIIIKLIKVAIEKNQHFRLTADGTCHLKLKLSASRFILLKTTWRKHRAGIVMETIVTDSRKKNWKIHTFVLSLFSFHLVQWHTQWKLWPVGETWKVRKTVDQSIYAVHSTPKKKVRHAFFTQISKHKVSSYVCT